MIACTVVARNYLAQARVLARSFVAHHHNSTMFVLVIDDVNVVLDDTDEPFTIVRPGHLNLPEFLRMATMYDVTELSTAVKPAFLRYLLARTGNPVVYLDPDIEVFDRLDEVETLAAGHGLVLTPHLIEPLPTDKEQPADIDILVSGAYNLGFIAVAPRDDVVALLDWWHERLAVDCIIDHATGYFVDQRWMDLAPGFVSDLHILRDPGYNVAYWNLSSRNVVRDGSAYTVNGVPLRFMHYSGYDPSQPFRLSRHQTREQLVGLPSVAELFERYGKQVEAARAGDAASAYGFAQSADGLQLAGWLRRLYREGVRVGDVDFSAFDADGAAQLRAWLLDPATRGARAGLNRATEWLWRGRSDLQAAYPRLDEEGGLAYAGWLHIDGRINYPDIEDFLPPPPSYLLADPRYNPSARGAANVTRPEPPWGVNVVGYLRSELGVGEAARLMIAALDARNIPNMPVHGSFVPSSRQGQAYDFVSPDRAPFPVNLICVNADLLPTFVAETHDDFFAGRYKIGLWWWEVESFPEEWLGAFDLLDEVWVATQHIADTLSVLTSVPIVKITLPVVVSDPPRRTRGELGLPPSFVFLFMFDFNSVMERKNPIGVIEAFKRAFPEESATSLVIKSINAEFQPEKYAAVLKASAGRGDIRIWDAYVSSEDKTALLASIDCYVSLHRAEGFGLTPAEALYLGKPVIATGYSGNLEFMTEENSFLVHHSMVPIGEGAWPYPAAGEWAEPDLDHAAELMRRVVEDPQEAQRRAATGAADLRSRHSPLRAGAAMERRLEVVRARLRVRAPGPSVSGPPEVESVAARVRRSSTTPVSARDRLRRAARAGALRAMRPYTAHQEAFGRDLLAVLADSSAIVGRIEEAWRGLSGRVGAGEAASLAERRRAGVAESALRRLQEEVEALRVGSAHSHTHEDLVGAHRDMLGSHQELVAAHDALAASHETLAASHQRLITAYEEVSAEHRDLKNELQARADTDLLPFITFDEPGAGRVYGFRSGDARSSEALYRGFEDLFRGREATIRDRQRVYVDLIGTRRPVLDVGCGRGEFLDLLRDHGVAATGIDIDAPMVERCHEKGHASATVADANEYLGALAPASLGVVFSAQVIEHLSSDQLERFLRLSLSRLVPGGLFVAETVNPHSLAALKNFWLDLTHQHPIFPEVALALGRIVGFGAAYVFYPNATGDAALDSYKAGDYALVATAPTEDDG